MAEGAPLQRISLRIPDAISLLSFEPKGQPRTKASNSISNVPAGSMVWSEDGALLALLSAKGVCIYDGDTEQQVAVIDAPNPMAVAFSPRNTYLTIFQRLQPGAGNAEKNLKVWRWREGVVAMQLYQKAFSRDAWPSVAFTADEGRALHAVTNAVNIYDPASFSTGVVGKLAVKGVAGFAVSPNLDAPMLAAYVPELKGSPGFAGIWPLEALAGRGDTPAPVARRSFFRATSAKLMWNAGGSAVLALTASEVDATNQSYYGEQKLSFLAADGRNDCLVPLKDGPVHDVQWHPSGEYFITVAGFMPAKSTLFTDTCKAHYDLGSGPHNIARWSPQGRFLALAGFGNLPGDVVFFDKKPDGKCKQMAAMRAENGVTCGWSPDGRHFLTATIAPRLRVDNGFQVYRYTGEKVHDERVEVLLEAAWRPAPPEAFPDLPQSPKANGSATPAFAPPPAAAGYVAPHLRGSGGAAAAASAAFSMARDPNDTRGRIGANAHHRALVPGAAPPESKTTSKNAKRRQRAKAKGPGGEADGEGDEPPQPSSAAETVTNGVAALSTAEPAAPAESGAGAGDAGAGGDAAKRLRNLQKKLRQVQQLKERAAAGGAPLEPEQLQKIAGEGALQEEIRTLEA